MNTKILVVCGEGFQGKNVLSETLKLKDIPVEDFIDFDEFETVVKKVCESDLFDGQAIMPEGDKDYIKLKQMQRLPHIQFTEAHAQAYQSLSLSSILSCEGKSRLKENQLIFDEFTESEEFLSFADEFIKQSMSIVPDSEIKTSSKKLKKLWNEAKRHGKCYDEIKELQQAYIEAVKEGR